MYMRTTAQLLQAVLNWAYRDKIILTFVLTYTRVEWCNKFTSKVLSTMSFHAGAVPCMEAEELFRE